MDLFLYYDIVTCGWKHCIIIYIYGVDNKPLAIICLLYSLDSLLRFSIKSYTYATLEWKEKDWINEHKVEFRMVTHKIECHEFIPEVKEWMKIQQMMLYHEYLVWKVIWNLLPFVTYDVIKWNWRQNDVGVILEWPGNLFFEDLVNNKRYSIQLNKIRKK